MDNFNPIDLIISIVIKGIMLGIVLAIAWPVKCLADKSFTVVWASFTNFMKRKEKISYGGKA